MAINGRRKGANAELEVAKILQEWWQRLESHALFVRTPQSGGWGNPTTRAEFRMSGDVSTTSPTFPFSIEAKRREDWSWDRFLTGKVSPCWAWWRQAQVQAKESSLIPCLFFRHSREDWHVLLPESVGTLLLPKYLGGHIFRTQCVIIQDDYGAILPYLAEAKPLLDIPPATVLERLK